MEILNTTVVTELVSWYGRGLAICGLIAIIGYFIFGLSHKSGILFWMGVLLMIGGIVGIFSIGIMEPQVETNRKRYEVILDEDISITEIYSKYDVIEQRGKIWILEDKK